MGPHIYIDLIGLIPPVEMKAVCDNAYKFNWTLALWLWMLIQILTQDKIDTSVSSPLSLSPISLHLITSLIGSIQLQASERRATFSNQS